MKEKVKNPYKLKYIVTLIVNTVIIVLLIIAISVNVTSEKVSLKANNQYPHTSTLLSSKKLDVAIASSFSTKYNPQYVSILYDTNIISDEDKKILKQMFNGSENTHIAIVFGQKDGKDVVCVCYGLFKEVIFESNLPYSFNDVISDLEKECAKTIDISEKPIYGSNFDNLSCNEISFRINETNGKIGYTYVLIDDNSVRNYYRVVR